MLSGFWKTNTTRKSLGRWDWIQRPTRTEAQLTRTRTQCPPLDQDPTVHRGGNNRSSERPDWFWAVDQEMEGWDRMDIQKSERTRDHSHRSRNGRFKGNEDIRKSECSRWSGPMIWKSTVHDQLSASHAPERIFKDTGPTGQRHEGKI